MTSRDPEENGAEPSKPTASEPAGERDKPDAARPAGNEPRPGGIDAIVETMIYLYTESRRLTKEMAREVGLTGPQLTVIKLLESFGDLSLSSLSERIRAQNSTVTGIIDRMEREGLVRRERSTADRRVILIRLSEKGRELARQIEVEPLAVFRDALATLSRDDAKDLLRILTKLQKRVRTLVSGPRVALPGKGGASSEHPTAGGEDR